MTSKPLTKIQETSCEIRNICQFLELFWYIVHVVLVTCSCRRLYSSKCFCPFPSSIRILVCHVFIEPAPFFQQDQIQTAFEQVFMVVPLHPFRILSDFGFQPLAVCLRFCLAKEINKSTQTSVVYVTTCLKHICLPQSFHYPEYDNSCQQ